MIQEDFVAQSCIIQRGDNVVKKEMIAMLLAGEQGGRLGVLTRNAAKAAVSFGGKYRIIDFPLSNCINSGIDTVGVLTQYRPLRLNEHIGIGIPWDLDRLEGGVTILPPYEKNRGNGWYTGTANSVYQNMEYMESCHPDYVLAASACDVYKMDYDTMLNYHKANNADVTVAVMRRPDLEEAHPVLDDMNRVVGWNDKNASGQIFSTMQVCIFSWPVLKETLTQLSRVPGCSFNRHVIPLCLDKGYKVYAYEFSGPWDNVSTLKSYWQANLDLLEETPSLNLYEEYWQICTRNDILQPAFLASSAVADRSIIGEGSEIAGAVSHSVLGPGVVVEEGASITDSVIMRDCVIGPGSCIDKAILAEGVRLGSNVAVGSGEYADSMYDKRVYCSDLAVIGEGSVIPDNVTIGRNTAVMGETTTEDYADGQLESGGYLIKAGEGE